MKSDLPTCPVTQHLEREFAALLASLPKPDPIPNQERKTDERPSR